MATKSAKRGLRGSASVIRFVRGISFDFVEHGFVECGLADDVLLAGPVAEIVQTAALAAERKIRVRF